MHMPGHGENRKAIKNLAKKLGDVTLRGGSAVGNKITTIFDDVFTPTTRIVEFEGTLHEHKRDASHVEQTKVAQKGTRHFKGIFAKPVKHEISFMAPTYPKNEADNTLIDEALERNFVFDNLPKEKRKVLIDAFEPIMVKAGTAIITQGDTGDYFYVLGAGEIECLIDGNVVGNVDKGGSFGELALLYDAPRAATCIAEGQCGLFRLDQGTFKRILAQQIQESHNEVIQILKGVLYFQDLEDKYLERIASNLKVQSYTDGEVIVSRTGGTPKRFHIIKEGKVDITSIQADNERSRDVKSDLKSSGPGSFFGEYAVTEGEYAFETATARGHVVCLQLERDDFIKAVGNDVGQLIQKGADMKKIAYIPFGKTKVKIQDHNELSSLADAVKEMKYKKGHVFFEEGDLCFAAVYFVREGSVQIHSSKNLDLNETLGFSLSKKADKIIERHGYFGNDMLTEGESGDFFTAQYTVTALEDVVMGVLDLARIQSVIEAQKQVKITMTDLKLIRILGAGTFGKVWLVQHNDTTETYALKIQNKKNIVDLNQAEGVIREKNIMTKLHHPFLIQMISYWKDSDKLYMCLKMYQGGELSTIIHTESRDGVPEWAAKFYAANILEGLSYMHQRNIVYRDLKPANVLLDSEGYTVIVDFGFAKIIKDNKTFTFCGTPLYLCPEIITQKGHNAGADHWSWGVMLYEMIVGMTPFYDGTQDQMGLFKNIVKCNMAWPEDVDHFMSKSAQDLITRMLTVNPADRLGGFAGGDKDIKSHPFFESINWEDLSSKKAEVPFKPKVSDPLDGSNFDDYSKLEAKVKKEILVPLTGAEQKLFDDF